MTATTINIGLTIQIKICNVFLTICFYSSNKFNYFYNYFNYKKKTIQFVFLYVLR